MNFENSEEKSYFYFVFTMENVQMSSILYFHQFRPLWIEYTIVFPWSQIILICEIDTCMGTSLNSSIILIFTSYHLFHSYVTPQFQLKPLPWVILGPCIEWNFNCMKIQPQILSTCWGLHLQFDSNDMLGAKSISYLLVKWIKCFLKKNHFTSGKAIKATKTQSVIKSERSREDKKTDSRRLKMTMFHLLFLKIVIDWKTISRKSSTSEKYEKRNY